MIFKTRQEEKKGTHHVQTHTYTNIYTHLVLLAMELFGLDVA